jgi:hypothetical protein
MTRILHTAIETSSCLLLYPLAKLPKGHGKYHYTVMTTTIYMYNTCMVIKHIENSLKCPGNSISK